MSKTVVIYESKYGYTKHYAEWIAEELSCPVFSRTTFQLKNLPQYKRIIYGGGLYAGGVSGIQFITKNWSILSDRHVVFFTCGLADPDNAHNISNIRTSLSKVLSAEMMERICFFHLRGGIDYARLSFIHRIMMSMLRRMLLKKEETSLGNEDKLLLETFGKSVDFTDRERIRPLIRHFS